MALFSRYTRALTFENFFQGSFSPTNFVRSRLSPAPNGAVDKEGGGNPPLQAHSAVPSPPPPNPTSCPPPFHPDCEAHEVQRLQRQSEWELLAGGGEGAAAAAGEGGRGGGTGPCGGGGGIANDRASPFALFSSPFLSTAARALPPVAKSRSFKVLGSLRGGGGFIEVGGGYASATRSAFEVQALSSEWPNINICNRLQRHGRGGSPHGLRRGVRDNALPGASSHASKDNLFPFLEHVAPPHQPGLCGIRNTLVPAGEQCPSTGEGGNAVDTGPAAFFGAQSLPIPLMPSAWEGLLSKIKALDDNVSLLRRDVNLVISKGEAKAAVLTSSPSAKITTTSKFTTTANFNATAHTGFTSYPHTVAPAAQPRHSYAAAEEEQSLIPHTLPRLPHQGSEGRDKEEEGLLKAKTINGGGRFMQGNS